MRKLRNFDKFYCIVFQEFYIHPLSREIHIPLIGLTVLCFCCWAPKYESSSQLMIPTELFKSFFVSCSNYIFVFMKINLKRTSWGILLALVFILVYYMHTYIHTHWVLLGITQPLFQIFQILKILKCLNDPTCAIFLKRMPNMTVPCIKYEIQKYTNTKCLEYPT